MAGLVSFRMDWLDLLTVQWTLKSLLQHHHSKASILRRSAFFTVQLSHPYMTNGKTIALTRRTLVGRAMSLLLTMLSRLVITFLPRSKRLLISWLQSPSAVILEPKKIVCHCFHCFPIYFPWSDRTRCHDLRLTVISWVKCFKLSKDDEDWVLTAIFSNTDVIRDLNKNIFSGLVGNRREQEIQKEWEERMGEEIASISNTFNKFYH